MIFTLVSAVAFAVLYQRPAEEPSASSTSDPVPEPEPVKHYSLMNGEDVKDEAALTAPVNAVILENSPDARPQSGMKDAEVVYEAIAEGGITRFLALYQNKKPQLVGPVRSLRR